MKTVLTYISFAVSAICCAIGLTIATAFPVQGEFLTVRSTGYYSDPSGTVKVIMSRTGILFLVGPAVSAQEFNLEEASLKEYTHCFIKFGRDASGSEAFSELSLGASGQTYTISGNVTIRLGDRLSIGIANKSYLTVSTTGPALAGNSGAFLAFVGLQKVLDGNQNAAVVLEANRLDAALAKLVSPYLIKEHEQKLYLDAAGNKPRLVTTKTIGVDLSDRIRQSRCLKDGVTIVTNSQLEQLRSLKSESEKVKLFAQFAKDSKKNNPSKNLIILKITPSSVLALDPLAQSVREIRELPTTAGKSKVCLLDDLAV